MITCEYENNTKASLRHVTVDAIIIQNKNILLIKRAAHLINPNKYALPGGFLDRDETTEEGIKREIKEETGFDALEVKLFKVIDKPNRKGEDRQNVDFVFIVKVGEKVSESDSEIKEVVWFDLNNLPGEEEFAFDHFETIQSFLNQK